MSKALAILDYSVHGNAIDAESDRLLAAAAAGAGFDIFVQTIAPGKDVRPDAERVWLRYDLRSRRDLSWIVSVAHALHCAGHRVFPAAVSILLAGDKWETYHALRAAQIPTPVTRLVLDCNSGVYPAILKPRVGWGGMGHRVLQDATDCGAYDVAEDAICQPFLPHDRMWIVPVAGESVLPAIEERREPERDGEVRMFPPPDGSAELAVAAAGALRLPAATVDIIDRPEGPMVLEVNSAPRIAYPDLPEADLATPMVHAVLDWMETCRCGS
jgi:glutathione synthase/RimK-type ligase-like ATP-grasp enzyme